MVNQIAVIGAGIAGLHSAVFLQRQMPTVEVTLIADKFGQETVSAVAAGIFHPGPALSGPTPEITQKWFEDSHDHYKKILKTSDAREAGVIRYSGYFFRSEDPPSNKKGGYMEHLFDVHRPCTPDELTLTPLKVKYGTFVTTMLIDASYMLPYLTNIFLKNGGKIEKRKLSSLEELAGRFDFVINCSGMGARELCGDDKLIPLRGQMFRVKAPWIKTFTFYDTDTAVLPTVDNVAIGVVRQFTSSTQEVDKHDSSAIWDRATALVPSLKNAEILWESVGLRPYRPVVRVEKEILTFGNKTVKVVHNYGYGGIGITCAPGASLYAVKLLQEMMRGNFTNVQCKL